MFTRVRLSRRHAATLAVLCVACTVTLGVQSASATPVVRSELAAQAVAAQVWDPPAPRGEVIAGVPWPQKRYDLPRISQLATGSNIIVAVIDSGVDDHNPQLAGKVIAGEDLLDKSGDGRLDCVGHGTAVASIIA